MRHKPFDRALFDVVAELAAGETFGDIGCGPAQAAAYLTARGVPTVAGDLSPAMCAAARRARSVRVCAGDLIALPIPS